MQTTRKTMPVGQATNPLQSLFGADLEDRVILSVHLLGKPTSAQLYRLHHDQVSNLREMQTLTARLSRKPGTMLASIKPFDIEMPIRKLPYVYLDTTLSRRYLQKTFGVPFKRPPVLPSRDWRFLRHDCDLVDELVAFELTARNQQKPFGYESNFDTEGAPTYPRVTVSAGTLTHTLRPQPDKTLVIGGYHLIHEKDNGEETITLGNIIRDATIARKHLVYDQLERTGVLDDLGWGKRIYTFTIDSKRQTKKSSRKRIKSCLENLPVTVNPHRIFFVDRQSFMEAGDDISGLHWVRGDGQMQPLPCW